MMDISYDFILDNWNILLQQVALKEETVSMDGQWWRSSLDVCRLHAGGHKGKHTAFHLSKNVEHSPYIYKHNHHLLDKL